MLTEADGILRRIFEPTKTIKYGELKPMKN
jgi:hypothetical protein